MTILQLNIRLNIIFNFLLKFWPDRGEKPKRNKMSSMMEKKIRIYSLFNSNTDVRYVFLFTVFTNMAFRI